MKPTTFILALMLFIARASKANCIDGDFDSASDCDVSYALAQEQSEDSQFILDLMKLVRSPLGPRAQVLTADLIAGVGQTMTLEQRRSWYILLAIESKFSQTAISSSQAVGIGQVVLADPQYIKRITGISTTVHVLKKDMHINLLVSSGIYRHLIKKTKSIVLTLVAYNAGINSLAVQNIKKITAINPETANYVAKHSYITEWMAGDHTNGADQTLLTAGL